LAEAEGTVAKTQPAIIKNCSIVRIRMHVSSSDCRMANGWCSERKQRRAGPDDSASLSRSMNRKCHKECDVSNNRWRWLQQM
jgi:hypothetical protein